MKPTNVRMKTRASHVIPSGRPPWWGLVLVVPGISAESATRKLALRSLTAGWCDKSHCTKIKLEYLVYTEFMQLTLFYLSMVAMVGSHDSNRYDERDRLSR